MKIDSKKYEYGKACVLFSERDGKMKCFGLTKMFCIADGKCSFRATVEEAEAARKKYTPILRAKIRGEL